VRQADAAHQGAHTLRFPVARRRVPIARSPRMGYITDAI